MNKLCLSIISIIISVLFLSISSVGFAQSIKERFKERLPQIIELKNEGIIGENNRGYLEFVGAKKKKENLIRAENRDRQLVYETIAKKENTSAEKVGKRRAIQLRGLASPGHWLQDENGNWYKK